MLLEMHMLKNYPPTNLNRDDSGSPKSCYFGGAQRGRISSQCLKRSWRTSSVLNEALGSDKLGVRTRKLADLVGDRLKEKGLDENEVNIIKRKVTAIGNKDSKEVEKSFLTQQIVFYSKQDIDTVSQLFYDLYKEYGIEKLKGMKTKDFLKIKDDAKLRPITIDIALFGRMVTATEFANVEASMQVAHAISTNRINQEADFFTAVDDLMGINEESDTGSAMIGDIDYNSNCYYIYAALDYDQLKENLKYTPDADEIIKKAIPAMIEAMALSNPSGKQNTFAGHILPDVVMVNKKSRKIPVSLANAFVEPAQSGKKNLVENSIEKMVAEIDYLDNSYDIPVDIRLWFKGKYEYVPKLCQSYNSFNEIINEVRAWL